MFSASEMNQALVKAFNISVCYNNIINTNLKVQNVHQGLRNKDYIVISFDKSMNADQCIEYLNNMKERIVKTFCGSESGANMSFNIKFFPFNFSKEQLIKDGKERYKFSVPMDKDVIFNLKCLLAYGFAKDAKEDMGSEFGERCMEGRVYDVSFDRKSYLYCMRFYDKRLQEYFIESFSATVKGYKNSPKRTDDFLKVKDNCVYIKKSLFDKTKFINEIEESQACLIGRDLQTSSSNDPAVEKIKYLITGFIRKACPPLYYVFHTSYSGNNEDSILVPIVSYGNYYRFLTKEEVDTINSIFGMVVLNNIESYTSPKHLPVFGSRGIYGIDFSNKEISHCVITQIIENSVINKDHELSIDPELRFQALSPPSTPVHNGYPIQNGSISGFNGYPSSDEEAGPSSKMSQAQVRSPTRSQDGVLKEPPRQRFMEVSDGLVSVDQVGVPGTSKGFSPSTRMSSTPVSGGVSGPSSLSQSVGATQNVQAETSASFQPIGYWSSQSTSGNQWMQSQQLTEPGPSCSFWQKPSQVSSFMVNESSSSGCKISNELPPSNKLNDKEKKLIKALLYTFNLTNYTFDGVYTNFFAKDGKIVSLLHNNVDREEYLQAVVEEYYETEKEARELYDPNEFPFKFLPDPDYKKNQNDYEENSRKTVVANISSGALSNLKILFSQKFGENSGALSNLKILFSQKFGENVDAIDIDWVQKVEKREKNEWVDRQRSYGASLQDACESCFPDEGPMKIIPIALEGDEYVLDRSLDIREVELLFKEQLRRLRDTSVAGKGESDDKPLTEEEKKLFKALLYAFNLNNYILECPNTNFFVENGKIASFINDGVDVKEYLQELRNSTIKNYCVTKEEAYDLNEFPFKFLSNCEKNQKMTVVANISRNALFNLKKLFIQEQEPGKKVKIEGININIVEKDVKSKKKEWVNSLVRERRCSAEAAFKDCYPDESKLKDILIIKGEKGGYFLGRNYKSNEVKEFLKERRYAKDTSKAKEMKPEDQDSGKGSSEDTTDMDCDNPSTSRSGSSSSSSKSDGGNTGGELLKRRSSWSDDESSSSESSRSGSGGSPRKSPKRESNNSSSESDGENTGKGSPKRTLELSMGMEELAISTGLDATKTEQHSPTKKLRSN